MRAALCLATLGLLAACAAPVKPIIAPVPGPENPADGVVTMSSNNSLFHPGEPDWREANATVGKRCRKWGYRGEHVFTGDQRKCLAWDRNGRCVRDQTRRFYQCEG